MTTDLSDTCKVGDPDPTPDHDAEAVCLNGHRNGWLCTRHLGHTGQHVACGREVIEVWPNENDLTDPDRHRDAWGELTREKDV